MASNIPKCGCVICQNNPDHLGERRDESGQSNVLGSLNPLAAIAAGTAIEAPIDGTPTDGTNPFIDSLVWGGRWQTPNSTKTSITYFLQSGTVAALDGTGYSWDTASKTAVEKSERRTVRLP